MYSTSYIPLPSSTEKFKSLIEFKYFHLKFLAWWDVRVSPLNSSPRPPFPLALWAFDSSSLFSYASCYPTLLCVFRTEHSRHWRCASSRLLHPPLLNHSHPGLAPFATLSALLEGTTLLRRLRCPAHLTRVTCSDQASREVMTEWPVKRVVSGNGSTDATETTLRKGVQYANEKLCGGFSSFWAVSRGSL